MKRFILVVFTALAMVFVSADVKAQVQVRSSYAGYLGTLDTLTNADTTTYTFSVNGPKTNISIQTNVTKISGTVAGTIKIYGSIDGTNYLTTALTTTNLTDASANLGTVYTSNGYQKYKVQIITSGTVSCSQRTYLLYR